MSELSKLLGNHFNDFENVYDSEMGKSNFSTLYKAKSKKLNKLVFLKIIDKEKLAKGKKKLLLRQIENQKKILSECKSDNIIEMYDYFETEKSFVFVLEYCETNSANYIKQKCSLDKDRKMFLEIVKGVANALKVLKSLTLPLIVLRARVPD